MGISLDQQNALLRLKAQMHGVQEWIDTNQNDAAINDLIQTISTSLEALSAKMDLGELCDDWEKLKSKAQKREEKIDLSSIDRDIQAIFDRGVTKVPTRETAQEESPIEEVDEAAMRMRVKDFLKEKREIITGILAALETMRTGGYGEVLKEKLEMFDPAILAQAPLFLLYRLRDSDVSIEKALLHDELGRQDEVVTRDEYQVLMKGILGPFLLQTSPPEKFLQELEKETFEDQLKALLDELGQIENDEERQEGLERIVNLCAQAEPEERREFVGEMLLDYIQNNDIETAKMFASIETPTVIVDFLKESIESVLFSFRSHAVGIFFDLLESSISRARSEEQPTIRQSIEAMMTILARNKRDIQRIKQLYEKVGGDLKSFVEKWMEKDVSAWNEELYFLAQQLPDNEKVVQQIQVALQIKGMESGKNWRASSTRYVENFDLKSLSVLPKRHQNDLLKAFAEHAKKKGLVEKEQEARRLMSKE